MIIPDKFLSLLTILGMTMMFMQTSLSCQDTSLYVSTADLNLREGPGTSYESIDIIKEGDTVEVLSDPGKFWVKIRVKKREGYSAGEFLSRIVAAPITLPEEDESNGFSSLLILLVLGLIFLIALRKSNKPKKEKPKQKQARPQQNVNMQQPQITASFSTDDSIIDVNEESLKLNINLNSTETQDTSVPYWSHQYVYSYAEIHYASKEQKQFYAHLKQKALKGEFVDIEGNTNYAFILYFDLLNEYHTHRDINLLERQFKLIGEICPKTTSYSLTSLKQELRKLDTKKSNERLEELEDGNYLYESGYSDYNPDLYKLGSKYKKKLRLNKTEVKWLNKFYNPSNVFNSIEGCCIAVIKSYLGVLNELNKEIDIIEELNSLFKKMVDIEQLTFSNYSEDYERKWAKNRFQEIFFLTTFKRIENQVRQRYGHKRSLTFAYYYPYSERSVALIEKSFGDQLQNLINGITKNISNPDLKTQIELNAQNVNRWTQELEEAKEGTDESNLISFHEALSKLEEANQKNSKIESIFFESAKFLANIDTISALKNYAKYLHYNISSKYKQKELPRIIKQKALDTEEKIKNYEQILSELRTTKDIESTLLQINDLFVPKRKRIKLNKSEIETVKKKHQGTVGLLNKYLETEEDSVSDYQESTINSSQEESIKGFEKSVFKAEIELTTVQVELIERIAKNSFNIEQTKVDSFATKNSMFKNQLIDSINESCEPFLDGEPLIEEEDELYIIEESFYQEILEK